MAVAKQLFLVRFYPFLQWFKMFLDEQAWHDTKQYFLQKTCRLYSVLNFVFRYKKELINNLNLFNNQYNMRMKRGASSDHQMENCFISIPLQMDYSSQKKQICYLNLLQKFMSKQATTIYLELFCCSENKIYSSNFFV